MKEEKLATMTWLINKHTDGLIAFMLRLECRIIYITFVVNYKLCYAYREIRAAENAFESEPR